MKDFFSKHDQIRKKLGIWSHLLKKYLMENFIFCALSTFSYEAIQTVIKVLENDKIFKFLKTMFLDTFISEENDGVLYFFQKN